MTGQYKKKVRNWVVRARVTSDEHKHFWQLCEEKGIDMSELIINSIMKSNSDMPALKGSIEEKYRKAIKTEYDSAMYDVVITSDLTKATWEYNAMKLVKRAIEKQSDPKNLKPLVKALYMKAKEVYHDDKLATTFTRLQTYLSDKLIYTNLRVRVMQTTQDRMKYLLNKTIEDINNKRS